MLLKNTIWYTVIVQQVRLLSKSLVKMEGAVCSMHVINTPYYPALLIRGQTH